MGTETGCDMSQPNLLGDSRRPIKSGLSLTLALLLLAFAATSVLAVASFPQRGTAGTQGEGQAGPPRDAAPAIRAGSPFTGYFTATAHLPLLASGYAFPPPYAWTGEIVATYQNCSLTRLFGFTLDRSGEPLGDIWVHYWADGWDGAWARSSWDPFGGGTPWPGDDGNWDGVLDNRPRGVVWHVCVVPQKKSWDCESNIVDAETSANCQKGVQIVAIDFRQN
jgi:hypothetical protein